MGGRTLTRTRTSSGIFAMARKSARRRRWARERRERDREDNAPLGAIVPLLLMGALWCGIAIYEALRDGAYGKAGLLFGGVAVACSFVWLVTRKRPRDPRKQTSRLAAVLTNVVLLVLVGGAGYFIYRALQDAGAETLTMLAVMVPAAVILVWWMLPKRRSRILQRRQADHFGGQPH